jgi:cytochrome c peroxidase
MTSSRLLTPTRILVANPLRKYFHNGIAPTLTGVVLHYEKHLKFVYTEQERVDLVAFLNAL